MQLHKTAVIFANTANISVPDVTFSFNLFAFRKNLFSLFQSQQLLCVLSQNRGLFLLR